MFAGDHTGLRNPDADATQTPRVSVVTMTFNRPAALRRCLVSLVAQTMPAREFEVVVVDVSTPPVSDLLAEFATQLTVVHVIAPNGGVAANRNVGANRARGTVLAFLDDDCRANTEWLAQLTHTVEQHPTTMVAGRVVHEAPDTAVASAGQVITEAVDAFFNAPNAAPRFLPGLNFAINRQAYLALGGCDARYGRLAAEDRDFVDRWRVAGGGLAYVTRSFVHHDHRASLGGFVRQYVNYGRGAWRYHRLRRERGSGRMADDLRLHTSLPRYLRTPLARVPRAARVPVVALLVVWQLANAAGFAWQAVAETLVPTPKGER
jgi:glycosyltransferase involved in cell wall biosynthesis